MSEAPGFEPDLDDSAKAIVAFNLSGRPANPKGLIEVFETRTHFRVYPGERDPSFSANCNALSALLCQRDLSSYSTQITKLVNFLCNHMWHSNDEIRYKWVRDDYIFFIGQ